MPNNSSIPSSQVPIVDPATGIASRGWFRFFSSLYQLTGAGQNNVTLTDLQLGPPPFDNDSDNSAAIAALTALVAANTAAIAALTITVAANTAAIAALAAPRSGFRAEQAGSTYTITSGVANAQITFDTEDWDILNEFDISTSTFTPVATGHYMVICSVSSDTNQPTDGATLFMNLWDGPVGTGVNTQLLALPQIGPFNLGFVMTFAGVFDLTAGHGYQLGVSALHNPTTIQVDDTWWSIYRVVQ